MPVTEFAGGLTNRVELWQRVDDRNAGSGLEEKWVLVDRLLARIEPEGAGLPTEAMTLSAMPRYRVTARVGPAFAIDSELRWKGRRMVIRQLLADPALPDRVLCRCEELR